jgi:hypothetical protein
VSIQLPKEIGAWYLLPYGESISRVARETAFFETITAIQGYAAEKLAGSVFLTIFGW